MSESPMSMKKSPKSISNQCSTNKMHLNNQIIDNNWLQFSQYVENCQDEKCAHCGPGKLPET